MVSLLPAVVLAIAFVYGITIGSFLNVAIWRLPRGGSVATPTWSYCPSCEHRLGTVDLVPVFSFLLLGARCRYCRKSISWRYPSIELLTGLLFLAVAAKFGQSWDTVFNCLFVAGLICVFFIDLEHFIIPDGLNLLCVLIGVAHNVTTIAFHESGAWGRMFGIVLPSSIKGMLVYASLIYGIGWIAYAILVGLVGRKKTFVKAATEYVVENFLDWAYLLVYYTGKVIPAVARYAEPPMPLEAVSAQEIVDDDEAGGMGGGDGKLAAGIGANIGWAHALQSSVFALFVGVVYGVFVLVKQKRAFGSRTPVPFGPAMVVGALIAMFFGPQIVTWYIGHYWTFPGSPFYQ